MTDERKPRPIRMNDEEWKIFKMHLGPLWLRSQIAKASKRNSSIPETAQTKDQDQ